MCFRGITKRVAQKAEILFDTARKMIAPVIRRLMEVILVAEDFERDCLIKFMSEKFELKIDSNILILNKKIRSNSYLSKFNWTFSA